MKTSTYNYEFKNGTITTSRGIITKFDWFVSVKLNDGYITLNQNIFLTRKQAKETTMKLLQKYNLI